MFVSKRPFLNTNPLYYPLALLLVDGIGTQHYQTLVSYCGSPEAVFRENARALSKVPQIPQTIYQNLRSFSQRQRVEQELQFIHNHNINTLLYTADGYPHRLKHIPDKPPILFTKGCPNLSPEHIIAIVGSRAMTPVGRQNVSYIVEALTQHNCTVVSGLAMGVDVAAHRACLERKIPTIGVMAHGLDRVYPAHHKSIAEQMCGEGGGLITEFWSGTIPDKENFPKRNRIVAGLVDAVIVVESSIKGGSLITARLANGYNREVLAIPGRLNDPMSKGCNFVIKNNEAHLYSGIHDLVALLNWDIDKRKKVMQTRLFESLNIAEQQVLNYLKEHGSLTIDKLVRDLGRSQGSLSSLLLSLEFKGLIASLPGKRYTCL